MQKLSFPKKTVIEVIGNVASGKTTLTRKLPKVCNLKYTDIDLFEANPFLELAEKLPNRWVFTSELYFDLLRSKQIPKVLKELSKSPLILDQGFHMPFYMYKENRHRQKNMTDLEWDFTELLHEKLLSSAPVAQIIIFLNIPLDTLITRMNKRGKKGLRKHEKLYTRRYLEQLQIGLEKYVHIMKKDKRCKTIITYDHTTNSINTFGEGQHKLVAILSSILCV